MTTRIARALRTSRPWMRSMVCWLLLAAYGATGFFTVPSTSVAVTRAFGAIVATAVPPGVHWFWPWPAGRVDCVEVTRTFIMPVGYFLPDASASTMTPASLASWLTGDTNILRFRARVDYRIADPVRFLFTSEAPTEILRYVAGSAFTAAASALPVDELLTSGRLALSERVRRSAQQLLDGWNVGLEVLTVNLEAVDPPPSVVAAFQDVQNARADRERRISEAETYANGLLPIARGEAEGTVSAALIFSDQRTNRAHADAERFSKLAAEHRRAPALLERRLYLETTERVLSRVRRYVIGSGGDAVPIRIVE